MQPIDTKEAPAAIGPYSQGMRAGGLVFLSGQIPLDPATGQIVPGDVAAQAERVLEEHRRAILARGGLRLRATWCARRSTWWTSRTSRPSTRCTRAFFAAPYPARVTVQVSALPRGALVEIDAIASAR